MENVRYKEINEFLDTLTTREKKFLYKKIKRDVIDKEYLQVNFTINGEKVAI